MESAEGTVINIGGDHDGRSKQSEKDKITALYCRLSAKSWNAVVLAGLKACGYIDKQRIKSVVVQSCDCEEAG